MSDLSRVNCAGQLCEEREECKRYRLRLQSPVKSEHPVFDWASFDIERIVFGDCLSLVRLKRG
jgi:hypothetical protein